MQTLVLILAGLWLGTTTVMADAAAAYAAAEAALAVAKTEQAVEDAFQKGAAGIAGPDAATYRPLLEQAREEAWSRVALPEGIRVTHCGVKPGKTAQGKEAPIRVFGFEVTGAYPVREVWGRVVWIDTKGNMLQQRAEACLFAAEGDGDAVQPGKSIVREREFFLAVSGSTKGSPEGGVQVMVAVTRVLHVQK